MSIDMSNLLPVLIGIALGALLATIALRATHARELARRISQAEEQARAQAAVSIATLTERLNRLPQMEAREMRLEALLSAARQEIASLKTRLEAEREHVADKLALLSEARQGFTDQFKNLASEILEDKSRRFTEQNQTQLGQLLDPLRARIAEFRSTVEDIHRHDTAQQASLHSELQQMKDINLRMTREAHELATALRGEAKAQGNWGELVLDNVLQRSGLRPGEDYRREVSIATEEGRRRPDVIVDLPQHKHLVIDAKVSLNAYTRYANASDPALAALALREHVAAVVARIDELSDRRYFELPGLDSPELVFLFMPIESALVAALRADETLLLRAIERQVLIATPTTLLSSLHIVRQLWRFEQQNAHSAELAERAAKVYKKLLGFLESMEALGRQLERARESFGAAMGQLHSGKGNLISQAREFERLGVAVQTPLPDPPPLSLSGAAGQPMPQSDPGEDATGPAMRQSESAEDLTHPAVPQSGRGGDATRLELPPFKQA